MNSPAKDHCSNAIVCDNARFSFLGKGLLRLEYAPDMRFDDRPTFRTISMPAPQPFDSVSTEGGEHTLKAAGIELRYRPTDPFSPRNLSIHWHAGGLSGGWSPGDRDHENLGGITTLDHVGRTLVAEGVHATGAKAAERLPEQNLMHAIWETLAALKKKPELDPQQQFRPENLLAAIDLLPEQLREKFELWRKFPPGPLSRAGYAVLDETGMAFYDPDTEWLDRGKRPGYQNIFFLYYGRDYAEAMRLLTALCGRVGLPPRWALGPWFSCFERLSADQNRELVAEFERQGIPLDVLVLDMDWHTNGWDGWEWNTELYPELSRFFDWKRQAGVKIALNLHCETISRSDAHFQEICRRLGHPKDVADPPYPRLTKEPTSWAIDYTDREVWEALRSVCLAPNEDLGVDFWWLDNWQGCQDDYNSVLWINHLFCRHMEQTLGVRPLILGRYCGIGSQRYPVYFSGDTFSHWEVLRYLLEVNIRAGHIGMAYLSHDLGGFHGPCDGEPLPRIDPELYVRWTQMGALCPVMRVHSHHGRREPWEYGRRALASMREAYRLHTRLVPYFYHLARQAYDSGLPPLLPLYFLFPDNDHAYEVKDQYVLGGRLLVAPVATPGGRRSVYVPPGEYYSLAHGEFWRGPTTLERVFELEEIPLYVRAGSIIPQQEPSPRVGTTLPNPLILAVYPGGNDQLTLYEDDGSTPAYQDGAFTRWPIALQDDGRELTITIDPVRGGFAGMLERRTVRIEVNFVKRPADVRIDGGAAGNVTWTYQAKSRRLVVTLPDIPTSGRYRMSIER